MMRSNTRAILPGLKVLLLGLCIVLVQSLAVHAQAPTATPAPAAASTPAPTPTMKPLAISEGLAEEAFGICSDLKASIAAALGDSLDQAPVEVLAHGQTYCRMLEECLWYIHQGPTPQSDNFFNTVRRVLCPDYTPSGNPRRFGSVLDQANSQLPEIARVAGNLRAAIREGVRESTELRDRAGIAAHQYDLGNESFLEALTGDFGEIFDKFFECLDYSIEGFCHKTETHWTPPFVELYIAALRRYRFPVQYLETSEHEAMTAYLPRSLAGIELPEAMLNMGKFVLDGELGGLGDAYDLAKLDRQAVNPALEGAAVLPGALLGSGEFSNIEFTDEQDERGRVLYDRLKNSIESGPNADVTSRIRQQPKSGVNMQYHAARSWFDVMMGPIWQKMALIIRHPHYFNISIGIAAVHLSTHFGGCHDRKVSGSSFGRGGPGDCNQDSVPELSGAAMTPYWSEGGLYAPLSVLISHSSLAGMALLLTPQQALTKIMTPFACSLYNMAQGNDRLRTPSDLMIPFGRRQALAELLPAEITKHCGTGNQMDLYPVLARVPQKDPRAASEHQTLAGMTALKTTLTMPRTRGSPLGRFYDYSDYRGGGNANDDDNDRIQWVADDEMAETREGCQPFGVKTLRFPRDFSLASRQKVPGDEEKVAMRNVAYHWKRFKCCHPWKGRGIALASDDDPPFIVRGDER